MRLFSSPTTRLERRRLLDRAWERYVQDGIQPAGVSDDITESWRRAREAHRIDPGLTRPARVLSGDALAERCERDDVLRVASPILRDFAARLGIMNHVLAWFDGDGFMLWIDGDARVVERVQGIEFRPGANWAEDSAGTNGPGTALAAGKPVEVFASEHFVAAWQHLSCAAVPVRRPGQAAPAGLVDITGPWEVQRRQALLAARAIARAVEERLRAAATVRDEVVRYAFRAAHEGGDAVVAVDARGEVLAANDAAARRRLVDAGALPPAVRDALAGILRSRTLRGDLDLRIETAEGRPVTASPVEYDGTPVGAILRVSAPASAPRPTRARPRACTRYDFDRILGRSDRLRVAVDLARTASRNDLPVLLCGESGTGKELFAQAIHTAGGRQGGPFVAVNCGSIPAQLVEAELFGYEAGTFTGARKEGAPGRFEDADGGTIFLDEVSELPPPAQTALLRVLQEKEVVRLGGSVPRPLDVRVVAATNKPLDEEMRARRFRRDLYYRLNVLSIAVPPLRERGPDVTTLAHVFLAEAEAEVGRRNLSLADDALAALVAHSWPGNVRELKNVLLRAAATAPAEVIRAGDLLLEELDRGPAHAPQPAGRFAASPLDPPATLRETVLESERDALVAALDAAAWNFARAAQRLGISRMTLYRRLERCGISRARAPGRAD
jgi:sigma-54 dependent transcriptional regulator, acetoin dehydrogenase operon transcriptional activator AcoR